MATWAKIVAFVTHFTRKKKFNGMLFDPIINPDFARRVLLDERVYSRKGEGLGPPRTAETSNGRP